MLYDGDLHQYDKVLAWLTSQDVFEIKNEVRKKYFILEVIIKY